MMDLTILTRIVLLFNTLFKLWTGNVIASISHEQGHDGLKHFRRIEKLKSHVKRHNITVKFG